MNKLLALSLLSAVAFAAPASHEINVSCRCRPHEPCWPSHEQWSGLNASLNHNLIAVKPAASVCSPRDFDADACQNATENWSDSLWRVNQPGAVQYENWEAWPEHHQSCYIETAANKTCSQGRISLYSAQVHSASDVQQAVRFAKSHNLRLVIKNTGHDFLGRSTAPYSLQIATRAMKNISVVNDFLPMGAPRDKREGPAAHIAAGVELPELYAAVARYNRTVMAGSAHTVGAAGGYIQGGGHSPIGAWKGLGSDNALEFEVVTANGTLVTANAYQNSDLFWALRGGGGGTFGVVTRATIRTFPNAPVVFYNLNFTTSATNPAFWDAWTEWHSELPSINDAGGSGYYYTLPNVPLSADLRVATMVSLMMFPEKTDPAEIRKLYEPLRAKLAKLPSLKVQEASIPFPTISSLFFNFLLAGSKSDSTSGNILLASRLFSKDLMLSKDGPHRLTEAWRSIGWGPYDAITSHAVAGGAVAANGAKIDSAVNPAWRKTVSHMLFSRGWAANATFAEQKAIMRNMTEVQIPILRSVEGEENMGAYMNEANGYEPGFQQSFWGKNYPHLYSIKQKWDPSGLFIARKGVGSEDWDDAGLCRITRKGSGGSR